MGIQVTEKEIDEWGPDAVVLATGAHPTLPGWTAASQKMVVFAEDVLMGNAGTGLNVLIIGGGSVGCETAHFLAEYGKFVTVIEMTGNIGAGLEFIPRSMLLQELGKLGVKILTSARAIRIVNGGVVIEQDGRAQELSGFDSIVIALGYTADQELFNRLKGSVPELYLVGDAERPSKIMECLSHAVDVGCRI
jgi:2-enoate reductase